MDIAELKTHLDRIANVSDEEFMAGIESRKKAEMEFHDRHRDRGLTEDLDQDTYERLYGNRKYYAATRDSMDYEHEWMQRNVPGKVFLDYCCGDGAASIRAAKAGAALVVGIDISRVSVDNSRRAAEEAGVADRTYFLQADAENTRLPDQSVDIVLCRGILHHLDLSYAFPEIRRILRIGGKVFAVEALDYNPAIKLYRKLTPAMRTEWEQAHILDLSDLRFASRFFEVDRVRYWHLLSVLQSHVPWLGGLLQSADRVLTRIPIVQLMAWIFTFELTRRT